MARKLGWIGAGALTAGLLMMTGCATVRPAAKGLGGQEGQVTAPAKAAPPVEKAPAPPSPSAAPAPPVATGYRLSGQDPTVAARISLFERKQAEWSEAGRLLSGAVPEAPWQECRQAIDQALAGYRRLQAEKEPGLNPWEVVGQDVRYFEHNCDRVLLAAQAKAAAGKGPAVEPQAVDPVAVEHLRQLLAVGQYLETVAAAEALARGAAGQTLPAAAREAWARALVKLGRFREAASLLAPLAQEGGTGLADIEIRLLAADVLMASGQAEAARQAYDGLSSSLAPLVGQQTWAETQRQTLGQTLSPADLNTYREIMQAYLRFDGHRLPQALTDGVAALEARGGGPVLTAAKLLLAKLSAESQAWCQGQLAEVRRLLDSRDLAKARALLDQVSAAAPADMAEAINRLQAELAQAEGSTAPAATGGGAQQAPAPTASPWDEAMKLLAQRRYDEAIAAFQQLSGGERDSEAKAKIAEASERAATALRQQAAALYAKAKKTPEPEARRQALQDSRALLQGLIDRYPAAPAVGKARQNLKVIDAELAQLGGPAASDQP